MHALPQRRGTRLAMLAGAAAMGVALIGAPAKAAEAPAPTTPAVATVTPAAPPAPAPAPAQPVAPKPAAPKKSAAQIKRAKVIALARKHSGRPYRFGAAGPKAFDCSGYTSYLFKKVGVKLAHSSRAQARKGVRVARKNARPGDLVIFRTASGRVHHVGVYAGGNTMYDAPHAGSKTGKHKIWTKRVEFRRVL